MPAHSAGVLPYRLDRRAGGVVVQVLLVHPGGPFWARRDLGAWSVPKGEFDPATGVDPLDVARREAGEELGTPPPPEGWLALGELRQRGGKLVVAWAVPWDLDASSVVSNTFELEWPPRSGRRQAFPEVDRAAWFDLAEARRRILVSQVAFLDRLLAVTAGATADPMSEGTAEADPTAG